jgi:hypothetical protein
MHIFAALALVLSLFVGCKASDDNPYRGMTERQKDSILGASKVPGAGAVHRAMGVVDSVDARTARQDSAGREP